MNRNYFLILLVLFTVVCHAQNDNPSKTIEVVGSAKISVTPDIGILNIGISHIDSLFSNSIQGLNKKSREISAQLLDLGFEKTSIRTENFDVQKNQVYRENRTIDSGYIARQEMQLEFKNNRENINKLLSQFSKSSSEFELNLNFKLSDTLKESVQTQLIPLATKDAFKKVKLIAEASGSEISDLRKINYGTNFNSGMRLYDDQALNKIVIRGTSTATEGFTPRDQVFSDEILVIWNIK